jgi:hypothetical protein
MSTYNHADILPDSLSQTHGSGESGCGMMYIPEAPAGTYPPINPGIPLKETTAVYALQRLGRALAGRVLVHAGKYLGNLIQAVIDPDAFLVEVIGHLAFA